MRIVITGGVGFLGSNIALEAVKQGHEVIAFDSFIRKGVEENAKVLKEKGVKIIRGDVRNPEDFNRLPEFCDGMIHLAANPGIPWSLNWPMYDFKVNAQGTVNALEFCRMNNTPFIFASSNKVYPDAINTELNLLQTEKRYYPRSEHYQKGIKEDFPVFVNGTAHSPYGCSKLYGDVLTQEYRHVYGLPTFVNRMSAIYGLYQKGVADQGWVDWFIRAKKYGKPLTIFGDGKQVRDLLFGEDVAKLYIKQMEYLNGTTNNIFKSIRKNVFNVGGGPEFAISLNESIEILNSFGGKPLDIKYEDWRQADHKWYVSNANRARRVFAWTPEVSPKEGMKKMWGALPENEI